MTGMIGQPIGRVDGHLKVTGKARYAAEYSEPDLAYAVVVSSTIGLGRIAGIATEDVEQMPGVIAVITHKNAQRLPYNPNRQFIDPPFGERLHVLQDDEVRFFGQPIAVVVAQTLEKAERAAYALTVTYSSRAPQVDPTTAEHFFPEAAREGAGRVHADVERGEALAALQTAEARIDVHFTIQRENHNPMEPHATVAKWEGDKLTLWSKSQFVVSEQAEISAVFGIPAEKVRVVSPFVGGAFGTSLRTWPHVTLAALASRHVDRPVKLVLTRRQMFYTTGHRPFTLQRVAIGADKTGKLTSIVHEGAGETSRYEEFIEALTSVTSFMYSCPNVRTTYRMIPLDTSTPTYMRGPGEAPGMHALECALDELAYKLGLDPIELRKRNEPILDEERGIPFSSRSMLQCYELGADKFGWNRRSPNPRSMTDGRLLIGYGMSSASYPCFFAPANAQVRLMPDGSVEVEAAASDMGPGTYTSMSQVASEYLNIPIERIKFALGRSDYPATPPHGGSMTMASVGSAVRAACLDAKAKAVEAALKAHRNSFSAARVEDFIWRDGAIVDRTGTAAGLPFQEIAAMSGMPIVGLATASRDAEAAAKYSMHSFGAVFAEVAIDPDVSIIRVRRVVGAYGVGKVVNPILARSQCIGGIIGGIGMAIMERTVLDRRNGRPINAHLADYLVPVNLDTPQIDVFFVDENDPHVNPLGVKGLGEISLVGVSAAIANAIFHATGKRVHELPIMIENLI
jgi:xanthine dehydrogenase YagR molybdenum-binding subunit